MTKYDEFYFDHVLNKFEQAACRYTCTYIPSVLWIWCCGL